CGKCMQGIPDRGGTGFVRRTLPADWIEIDSTHLDSPGPLSPPVDPYAMTERSAGPGTSCARASPGAVRERVVRFVRRVKNADREHSVIRMPSCEEVSADPVLYAHASRILHMESNPGNARALVQRHGDVEVWL